MAGKKQLMAQVAELFADGRQRRAEQERDEQIGRLKMEFEWLKKPPRPADVKRRYICRGFARGLSVGCVRDRFTSRSAARWTSRHCR